MNENGQSSYSVLEYNYILRFALHTQERANEIFFRHGDWVVHYERLKRERVELLAEKEKMQRRIDSLSIMLKNKESKQ